MAELRPLNEVVDYLDQQHSEDQSTIADNLLLALVPLWNIMSFTELDSSSIMWTEAVVPRVRTAYLQSQRVAAAFAANVRYASLATADPAPIRVPDVEVPLNVPQMRFDVPDFGVEDVDYDPVDVIELDPFPEDDVRLSLMIEGNFNVKAKMPAPEAEVMQDALTNSSGTAVRQSLKGARNVTNNVLKFDRKVLGYARFTDSNPCHFCALLASRGAVYGKHSFVGSDAGFTAAKDAPEVPADYIAISKVHNHCRCTLRPVYSKSQEFDADAKFYRKQWNDLTKNSQGSSPAELVQKWRDSYVPFVRTPADTARIVDALKRRESDLLARGFSPDSPQVSWARRTQGLVA